MQVRSHKEPQKIELRQNNGKVKEYFLRNNITTEQINQQGETVTMYVYDEVKIKLVDRNNLETFIKNNFNLLFEQGQLEESTPDKPSQDGRISELEDTILNLLGV